MSVSATRVPISSPCPIELDRSQVTPGDRRMFCGHCDKHVHLLSAMSESEARSFLAAEAGADICVSYAVRPNGEIRFRPDPANTVTLAELKSTPDSTLVPLRALTRRRRASMPVRLAMAGAAMLAAACAPHTEPMSLQIDDDEPVSTTRVAPVHPVTEVDEAIPCDGADALVDGGIKAVEVEPQVAGGITAVAVEPPEPPEPAVVGTRRGRMKAPSASVARGGTGTPSGEP